MTALQKINAPPRSAALRCTIRIISSKKTAPIG